MPVFRSNKWIATEYHKKIFLALRFPVVLPLGVFKKAKKVREKIIRQGESPLPFFEFALFGKHLCVATKKSEKKRNYIFSLKNLDIF